MPLAGGLYILKVSLIYTERVRTNTTQLENQDSVLSDSGFWVRLVSSSTKSFFGATSIDMLWLQDEPISLIIVILSHAITSSHDRQSRPKVWSHNTPIAVSIPAVNDSPALFNLAIPQHNWAAVCIEHMPVCSLSYTSSVRARSSNSLLIIPSKSTSILVNASVKT